MALPSYERLVRGSCEKGVEEHDGRKKYRQKDSGIWVCQQLRTERGQTGHRVKGDGGA